VHDRQRPKDEAFHGTTDEQHVTTCRGNEKLALREVGWLLSGIVDWRSRNGTVWCSCNKRQVRTAFKRNTNTQCTYPPRLFVYWFVERPTSISLTLLLITPNLGSYTYQPIPPSKYLLQQNSSPTKHASSCLIPPAISPRGCCEQPLSPRSSSSYDMLNPWVCKLVKFITHSFYPPQSCLSHESVWAALAASADCLRSV
jgi:hypothetical protein